MSVTEVRRTALAKWMFRTGTPGRVLARKVGTSDATISRLKNGQDIDVSDAVREKIMSLTGLKRLD